MLMKPPPLSAYSQVHTRAAVEVASAQGAKRDRFSALAVKRLAHRCGDRRPRCRRDGRVLASHYQPRLTGMRATRR